MSNLSLLSVQNDYNRIKKIAQTLLAQSKFDDAIQCISTAANVAYTMNHCFADDELESMCELIGKDVLVGQKNESPKTRSQVVFYDCFAYDSRGLTQQYIRALAFHKIPFTFILNGGVPLSKNPDILNELQSNPLAEIIEIDQSLSSVDRIQKLYSVIQEISPSKAFLHMTPNDVVGVAAWSQCHDIVRYQVNLTDHAFWLGKSCIDYCIEFRPYGRSLSKDLRGIAEEKLMFLPYYPIRAKEKPFQGFPFEKKDDQVILFSGGSFYKFYGDNDTYFSLIKAVLDKHSNTLLVIAGDGNRKPFYRFVKENGFEDRIHLLGNRSDISAIYDNVDIYLNSYPTAGALMSQFAAMAELPIVGYTTEDLPINYVESFLLYLDKDVKLTFTSKDEYLAEVGKLIDDGKYRKKRGGELRNAVISPDQFNELFRNVIDIKECAFFPENTVDIDIDPKRIFKICYETDEKYLQGYNSIFLGKILTILSNYSKGWHLKILFENRNILFRNLLRSVLFFFRRQ